MKLVLLLVLAQWRVRRLRAALTIVTVAAATALVVWVVSGYDAGMRGLTLFAERTLGHYTLVIDPVTRAEGRALSPDAIAFLRAQPEVELADPMWTIRTQLHRPGADHDEPHEPVFAGTDAVIPPFTMSQGRWIAEDASDEFEVVLSAPFADELELTVGDRVVLPQGRAAQGALVVGILSAPPTPLTGIPVGSEDFPSPGIVQVFMSLRDLTRVTGAQPRTTFIGVRLRAGVDTHTTRFAWAPPLSRLSVPAQVMTDVDMEEDLAEASKAGQLGIQRTLVTALAAALAFLVVFGVLSMGVAERQRQFALLRAVVATRAQIAALVITDGLLLAAVGAVLGMGLGIVVVDILDAGHEELLRHGATTSASAMLLGSIVAVTSALVAGLLPAWRATRVRPLDAIAPPSGGSELRPPSALVTVAGVVLLALGPLLSQVFPPDYHEAVGARLVVIGLSLGAGLVCLAPVVVYLTERLAGPMLARLLGLPVALLVGQLSVQRWRCIGIALTLSLGLGLHSAIQVWGLTMVETFVPGAWAPEATVIARDRPFTADEIARARTLPGIDASRTLPVVTEQPRLAEDYTNSADKPSVTRQMSVVIVGLDIAAALDGDRPLIGGEWVAGNRTEAIRLVREGRGCLVPHHFLRDTGFTLGSRFSVVPPEDPTRRVEYVIAGALRWDGANYITKGGLLRTRTHRTAALVMADAATVTADFALKGPRHLWLRMQPGVPIDQTALDGFAASMDAAAAVAVPTEAIGNEVREGAEFWLWIMSVLPLVTIGIAALGVLSVLLAALQARRWGFGILRAVGFTRSMLLRLVLAECLLIGVVACVVGVSFGILAGWIGAGIANVVSWYGGLDPVLVVPPVPLVVGSILLLCFTIVAALGPALRITRTAPLDLLAGGRSVE